MLVFYRSREYTNAIVSSTKAKLAASKSVAGLDVEFINLDKRNYIKVLNQMEELPRFVYIWFDEEKITDYINETYPSIEVIHFCKDNSVDYDNRYGYTTKDYKLADLMIKKFKENLVKRAVYSLDRNNNYKIAKENMDDLDITNSNMEIFNTRDEAKHRAIDCLKNEISRCESNITDCMNNMNNYKADLKRKQKLLDKFESL